MLQAILLSLLTILAMAQEAPMFLNRTEAFAIKTGVVKVYVEPTKSKRCWKAKECHEHCGGPEFTKRCHNHGIRWLFRFKGKCVCAANAKELRDAHNKLVSQKLEDDKSQQTRDEEAKNRNGPDTVQKNLHACAGYCGGWHWFPECPPTNGGICNCTCTRKE
jgi:hypothetical protein